MLTTGDKLLSLTLTFHLEDWDGYVGRSMFLVRPTCYKLQTFTRINR